MGAGPAGLTAGIYVGREGLKTKILEKGVIGGNANNAPLVANFPGFQSITGIEFLKKTAEQAKMYTNIVEYEEITKIHKTDGKLLLTTNKGEYSAKALIICSGTTYRKLGIKDEGKFIGRGISYCSICDGMFFKGKEVLVVGGGNSAAEHALHLKDLGCNVKIVHRRNTLRAQKYLQDKIHAKGIPIIWNSIVTELKGNNLLKSVVIRNTKTEIDKEVEVAGIYIAVGETPNSELAASMGVDLDELGYITTDKNQRTDIPQVYVAGDVTGGVQQIVVACGEGAVAAVNAYQNLP
ncbi:Thioredoxin reductase [anaerobic digester metagenome]|jgi:thioredoxin reductase (NADPH)|uniref:Thioredoxin-disulfide reductase n=1 Tax=Methanobacterium subterraneum TaxID=59277 RepID=A0A2H4VSX0_9EURY|nr:FAD-dependent oxidoreductase [Methanobacterium subterraneum]AUB61201.1 thioredoxin-disulfide reductase [Methanobacterium subterraneum]